MNRWWLIFLILLCQYNSLLTSHIPGFFWPLAFSGLSTAFQGVVAEKAKDSQKAVDLILLLVQDIFCLYFGLVTKAN